MMAVLALLIGFEPSAFQKSTCILVERCSNWWVSL